MALGIYLRKYFKIQPEITLCYRPSTKHAWNDRCNYLDDNYQEGKAYNHRSILRNELIAEYDEEDKELNKLAINEFTKRLREDKISYKVWTSGNKSQHCHMFIDPRECGNIPLLKKTVLRYYGTYYVDKESGKLTTCKDKIPKEEFNSFGYLLTTSKYKEIIPDLQLSSDNHLIRAEFGIHEKTGMTKDLVKEYGVYFKPSMLKQEVWQSYTQAAIRVTRQNTTKYINEVNGLPEFKLIMDSTKFRKYGDGRERILFALIHLLKPKYTKKEDLMEFLISWYKYSSQATPDLSDDQIRNKINYHWSRNYTITVRYLREILDEIGAMGEVSEEYQKEGKIFEG